MARLKCNRSHPCENCVKRGDSASCSYASPGARKKSQSSQESSSTPDDMQNRIDRLEGLVLSLMTNGARSAGPTAAAAALSSSDDTGSSEHPQLIDDESMIKEESEEDYSDTDQVAKSFGVMRVDNNKTYYVGDAHWAAILSDVSGLLWACTVITDLVVVCSLGL